MAGFSPRGQLTSVRVSNQSHELSPAPTLGRGIVAAFTAHGVPVHGVVDTGSEVDLVASRTAIDTLRRALAQVATTLWGEEAARA